MTGKIVRTPTKASGGITEEEKVKLKAHADMWIKRILSTETTDFSKLEPAIKGLYRVANLAEPEVALVKSPIQMVFAFGAVSYLVEKINADSKQTAEILKDVIGKMNDIPAGVAPVKHYSDTCKKIAGKKGIENAKEWSSCYQGGAYWGQYESFLTAMRDVIGLQLPEYENYKYWEAAAIHGTFRVMHEKFCIVSDFPDTLKIDDQNRAHCQDGPSHRWRDGWELYHWHGTSIPAEWLSVPGHLTATMAIKWDNIEQRRCACEILGWAKILQQLDAKVIDTDGDPEIGELVEVDIPDIGKERFLRVLCGTGREFAIPVPPEMKTALEAQSWTWSLEPKDFQIPEVRT